MLNLKLLEAPRSIKRLIMLASDLILIPVAILLTTLLHSSFNLSKLNGDLYLVMLLTALSSALLFMRMGLYLTVVRFMGHEAMLAMVKAVSASTLFFVLFVALNHITISIAEFVIYWGVAFALVGGVRFSIREIVHRGKRKQKDNVLIYGAGSTGMQLLVSLHNGGKYEPVALVDDNQDLWGTVLQGVKVSSPNSILDLLEMYEVDQVLLAMPRTRKCRRQEILKLLEPLSIRVKTVPSFDQLVNGEARIEQLTDVDIEDLLGRDPVTPNSDLLNANIYGKKVLVTGAGGSIGAELCRQIIQCEPKRLILFERCEYALYSIDKELQEHVESEGLDVDLIAVLGCVQDRDRVSSVFEAFDVDTIYHAAAYKHVPMVEQNVIEGVRNNVFGTYTTAKVAGDLGVETFVLVSTDKAVRPTNVMGASKRMAELILQGLSRECSSTCYSMVRFGNVLGSSGSVVPLFKKQVKEGGPITVTHPEIIRYFMTIPEAAQLVVQAGAMAKGGDVFVLDMGEPVRIADLARTMVRLMGLEVKEGDSDLGDIEIKYSGLRPGEKLFEELLIGENAHGTAHPRIMKAHEISLPWEELSLVLEELALACEEKDCEAIRALLLNSETGYVPSEKVNDLVWQHTQASSNVLKLPTQGMREKVI